MSLASILNDNDDINFPEIVVGNLTADTITARVINGGGGGGGGIPTLAQVCTAGANQYGNVSCGFRVISDIVELDFKQDAMTAAVGFDPTSGCLRYTKESWLESGIFYDTKYNKPPSGGGNFSTPASEDLDMNNNAITDVKYLGLLPGTGSSKKLFTLSNNLSDGLGFCYLGGTGMANIYDDTYNIPPAGAGATVATGTITSESTVDVVFPSTPNLTNTFGVVKISLVISYDNGTYYLYDNVHFYTYSNIDGSAGILTQAGTAPQTWASPNITLTIGLGILSTYFGCSFTSSGATQGNYTLSYSIASVARAISS